MHKLSILFISLLCVVAITSCHHVDIRQQIAEETAYADSVLDNEEALAPVDSEADNDLEIVSEGSYPDIKYGVKNSEGIMVVPMGAYDEICYFNEGRARVTKNDKYGYINSEGREIVPPVYKDAERTFHNGHAAVYQVDKNGNYHYGFVDKEGNLITPIVYSDNGGGYDSGGERWPGNFSHGYAKVMKEYQGVGFIDTTGKETVPLLYEDARDRLDDSTPLLAVKKDGRWGFVDLDGNKKIEFIYDGVFPFKDGYAVVENNGYRGLIDSSGREIVPLEFSNVEVLPGKKILVENHGLFRTSQGLYSPSGDVVVEYARPASPRGALTIITIIFAALIPVCAIVSQCRGNHKKFTFGRILISVWAIILGAVMIIGIASTTAHGLLFDADLACILLPIAVASCVIVWLLQRDFRFATPLRVFVNIIGALCLIAALIVTLFLWALR